MNTWFASPSRPLATSTSSPPSSSSPSFQLINGSCTDGAFSNVTAVPGPSKASRLCYELVYEAGTVRLAYRLTCGVTPPFPLCAPPRLSHLTPSASIIAIGVAGGALLIGLIVVVAMLIRRQMARAQPAEAWADDTQAETVVITSHERKPAPYHEMV